MTSFKNKKYKLRIKLYEDGCGRIWLKRIRGNINKKLKITIYITDTLIITDYMYIAEKDLAVITFPNLADYLSNRDEVEITVEDHDKIVFKCTYNMV